MNAVITGATKGIGRAITDLLLEKGINVAICARTKSDLDQYVESVKSKYPHLNVFGFPVDLSKKSDIFSFAEAVKEEFETIDILVNNAGVFLPGMIIEEEEGALEKMIDTNLYSAYHLTRALVPRMISYGAGHIFNMCSIASITAYPNGGSYSISKFALLGFSKVLREELKDKNIKVTSILPGATWSASWAGVDLPDSRLMKASDIAKIVWNALTLSPSAVIEDIVIRPQLGDL